MINKLFKTNKNKKIYQLGLVSLLCLYGAVDMIGFNGGLKWVGVAWFSVATVAAFYKFQSVKCFFYTWSFIILSSSLIFTPEIYTCDTYTKIAGIGIIWLIPYLLYAILFYAIGRFIHRVEPKKLNANWIDVLAIGAFIAILTYSHGSYLAGYLNDLYHFAPTQDDLFKSAQALDSASLYVAWGLFLWPAWLWEFMTTACFVFLLTLPFYRLWHLKHAIVAATFMPAINSTPIFVCFTYYSMKQIEDVKGFFWLDTFWLDRAVIPIGIFFGGLLTTVLKKKYKKI